jgi:hypothetical protein
MKGELDASVNIICPLCTVQKSQWLKSAITTFVPFGTSMAKPGTIVKRKYITYISVGYTVAALP